MSGEQIAPYLTHGGWGTFTTDKASREAVEPPRCSAIIRRLFPFQGDFAQTVITLRELPSIFGEYAVYFNM